MELKEVTLMIFNLNNNSKFTFKSIKRNFPELDYRRFHEVVKILIHIGVVEKSRASYKRISINVEEKKEVK